MVMVLSEEPLDPGNQHFQPSTLQFTTFDTGNPTNNIIPGEARGRFNVRFNNNFTCRTLEAEITRRLKQVGGEFELKIECRGEAFLTKEGELSRHLADAIESRTGRRPEFSTTGGTSDARFIKDYCPVVEFGLLSATMHKIDEHVAVADILALSEIYESVLERFFDAGPG